MNKRKGLRASEECLKHFLNKFRDEMMKGDNQRRKELKENPHETLRQTISDDVSNKCVK